MGSLNLKLGTASIDLTGSGDLGNLLNPSPNVVLQLANDLASAAPARLADVPAGSLKTAFSTDQEAKWSLSGVNLTLSFKPTASGTITITKSGELFNYHPGDDPSKTVSIPVPAGHVYVSVAFQVGLSLTGGAAFSSGNFGVSGNISTNDQFGLVNHRCFPETASVVEAITAAFRGFALPFKSSGVSLLNDNDYLDFSFIGQLALGFGVTYGISGLLLGGRSGGEIQASFEKNPLGKIVFNAKPTFKASADFSIKYTHQDAFRVVVGRQKTGTVNGASLYLFRLDKSQLTTAFNAGIVLSGNATFNASTGIDAVLNNAAKTAVSKLPPDIQGAASDGLSKALQAAEGKIDGFVNTINTKVNDLLKKGNDQKIALQILQDRISTDTVLFQYSFDFNADPSMAGFDAAIKGDFATAITKAGVTLAPGSFVEHQFTERTTLGLQFFGLWNFTSVTTYFQNTKATYAGNGLFQLEAKTGATQESGQVGRTGQCQVYFSARASEKAQTGTIADLDVQLTFVLIDNKNRNSAVQTIAALESLQAPALTAGMELIRQSDIASETITVTCAFPKGAYEALKFDPPGPLPHPNDARNYELFTSTVARLDSNAPALFRSFSNWAVFNVTNIDQQGSTKPPERRHAGVGNQWPSTFPPLETLERARVGFYLEAGRHFMNLCEDLHNLTAQIDAATTEELYVALLGTLNGIIRQDVPVFFIKSALIALLQAANAKAANIQFGGIPPGGAVSLSFQAALQSASGTA